MTQVFSFFPVRMKQVDKTTIDTINGLKKHQDSISSKKCSTVNKEYQDIMSNYFIKVLEAEDSSSVFVKKALKKKIKNPFFRKYVLDLYYYTKKSLSSSPLYKIEMSQKIDNTIARLNKIKENV
jgi:hypothetical protein